MSAEPASLDSPGLLLDAMADPHTLRGLPLSQWEALLACARRNAVLAFLAERASSAGLLDEIPERPLLALQSPVLGLGVDVHHTICPPASRLRPDPQRFWTASEATEIRGVGLLCPADSVLHAAVHLFFDSDFDSRFRELIDLHVLTTTFGG